MKKKLPIIILIVVILLIILCGGIAFAYFFTDIFRSDKEMFFKYISENAELLEIFQDDDLEKYSDKQQNTAYTSNGSIKINNFIISDLDEETSNVLNGSSITFEGSTDPANDYTHKTVNLNYSDTETLSIEYANVQDYYGIKIDDVVNKYIAVENNNLKEFATTLGIDDETIEKIPDKIDFDNMTSLDLFTDEEIAELKSTYLAILTENLTDDMFSKSETTESEIYTLTITEEQATNILCKLLEQLKDDEIIFNKIKQIMTENVELSETEANEYITQLKENIQDFIDELNDDMAYDTTDELNDDITESNNLVVNVYVSNKKLVETELRIDTIPASSVEDTLSTEGDALSISKKSNGFSVEYLEDGATSPSSITFEKTKSSDTLEYNVSASSDGNQLFDLSINFNGLSTLEQVQEGFTFNLNISDDNKIGYTYNNTKNFNTAGITQDVSVDDMFALNTAPSMENIENLFEQIGTKLDEVNNAHMVNVGLIEDSSEEESSDGENLTSENIVSMSNAITRNPFLYYVPAVIPLGVVAGMQNLNIRIVAPATVTGTAAISLGIMIYNNAADTIPDAELTSVNMTSAEIATFNSKFTPYFGAYVNGSQVNALIQSVITSNMLETSSGTERYITITFTDANGLEQTIGVENGSTYYSNSQASTTVDAGGTYYNVEEQYDENGLINLIIVTKVETDAYYNVEGQYDDM